MFYETIVVTERFFAFSALEWLFPCVCPHVAFQMTRCHTSVVAVVTFEWLFSSMLPHNVLFHIYIAAEITHCAFIFHFPVVDPFVPLHVDRFN